jgi:hypothetical protein
MKLRDVFIAGVTASAFAAGVGGTDLAQAAPVKPAATEPVKTELTLPDLSAKTIETRLSSDWSVSMDPMLPIGAVGGMAALYALFFLMAARRNTRGAWLRATAGGALALTLLNPEILHEQHEKLPTEVAVVVDKTGSQTLDGRDKETAAAYEQLMARLSAIPGVKIRTIEVGDAAANSGAEGSNLFGELEKSLADVPRDRLGAVFLLTDGQVHDIPVNGAALTAGAPIHALISGSDAERDRRIVIDSAPMFGLLKKEQAIKFHIEDTNIVSGPVTVTLSIDGKPLQTLSVTPGQPSEVKLNLPHAGTNIVELKTAAVDGELTDVNNHITASIDGIRDALNVLVVSGAPTPGVRMWRELIKSDPDTNLVHFTILRSSWKDPQAEPNEMALIPFPMNEIFNQKIDQFDLVVFDHYDNASEPIPDYYLEGVLNRVRDGGSLLVLPGADYSKGIMAQSILGTILPATPRGTVSENPYFPLVSDMGRRHPVTRALPGGDTTPPHWGRWTRLIDADKVAGQVIMEGPDKKPLLVLDHVGKGRVAMFMSDSAYLWARDYEGGGPSAELLRRISRWLMKDPALEEEALRLTAADGKLTVEEQTMDDKPAPVTIRTPSGQTQTVTPQAYMPGVWRVTVPAPELGLYSASQGGAHPLTSFLNVGPANPKEFSHTVSTAELLKPAADATGGEVVRMADKDGALALPKVDAVENGEKTSGPGWMGIRMTDASVLKGIDRKPLMPAWLGLLVMLGTLAGAWYREGDKKPGKKPAGPQASPAP